MAAGFREGFVPHLPGRADESRRRHLLDLPHPRPILILSDEADGVVLPFEPYMLLSAAHAEESLVS